MNAFTDSFKPLEIPNFGYIRLPEVVLDAKEKEKLNLPISASNDDFLAELCKQGLEEKIRLGDIKKEDKARYEQRYKQELAAFKELSFTDYILFVWDIINFCIRSGISTGAGRGSAAGSLALYLMQVTWVDSLQYNLLFERFLSKTRAKKKIVDGVTLIDGSLAPDIDLDISYEDRHKVVEYVLTKFPNRSSKLITFNTLSGKLLIKECGKLVSECSEQEMNRISDMVPRLYGKVRDIEKVYAENKSFKNWCDNHRAAYDIALKLRDLIKNKGSHASGYVISYPLLKTLCPLELSSKKELISGYDMETTSKLCIKVDLLGLREVSLVNRVCKMLNIREADIDPEDPFIYKQLENLKTPHGLFQIGADTNFQVLKKVKPKNLDQLSAVLAIARPGALEFADQYADYVNKGEYQSIHPFFDDILKSTGSIPLYQEQLMRMVEKVGFTLEEAETVRRIVGKKKIEEAKAWEQKIYKKIEDQKLDPEIGKVLWRVLDASKDYSFNKSHAVAYAILAAKTIYLKFKYPAEFFLHLFELSLFEQNPLQEISIIQHELKHFHIKLLSPHLLKSQIDFTLEKGNIRYGLKAVKGVGDETIEKLTHFRKEYSNKLEMFEGAKQAKIPMGVLAAILQAGAMEGHAQSRSLCVLEAQLWNLLSDKEKKLALAIGKENNFVLLDVIRKLSKMNDEKGKPFIKESRLGTIRKGYKKFQDIYKQNSAHEDLASWLYERALLGYSYSVPLKKIFGEVDRDFVDILQTTSLDEREFCSFVAVVNEVKEGVAKNEKATKYMRLSVLDESGSCTVMLFNEKLARHKLDNNGGAKKEDLIIVKGRKMNDAIFADSVDVQNYKVYLKLSDLKKENGEETEKK